MWGEQRKKKEQKVVWHEFTWDEDGLHSVDGQPPLTSLLIPKPIIPWNFKSVQSLVYIWETLDKLSGIEGCKKNHPPGSWRMEMQTFPSLSMLGCHISVRILAFEINFSRNHILLSFVPKDIIIIRRLRFQEIFEGYMLVLKPEHWRFEGVLPREEKVALEKSTLI